MRSKGGAGDGDIGEHAFGGSRRAHPGALSKRTGKDILLDVKQDPDLIGGVITQIGDLVLDGSIKTQLLNMRESMKRGEGA